MRRLALALALAALAAAAAPAPAGYIITVTEAGGPTIPIVDNGALDFDPTIGVINANTVLVNLLLVNYQFTNLGGTSNATTGIPFSNNPASVTVSGIASALVGGGGTVTVVASDDGFLFPGGDPKTMRTAASDTFSYTSRGDSRTFQSRFDATGAGGGLVNSPLLAFVPPVGAGPFGTSNPGVDTGLGAQPVPFTLSNTTVITLGPSNSPIEIETDQFAGATTVRGPSAPSVPEPASLALAGVGGLGLLVARRRRKATA